MILEDFHVHTNFCDGNSSAEEIVRAACEMGMKRIGFSAHAFTFFDQSYCMKKEETPVYQQTISALKQKYKGKIQIFCGIEQDYYAQMPVQGYDYVIGSVHYVKSGQQYYPIDESKEVLQKIVQDHYQNDYYALAEAYYTCVSDVVDQTHADIIGHFDLITKFNENNALFDEQNSRYLCAAARAIDILVSKNKLFEINTGAISRGYKTQPYPSLTLLRRIQEKGGKIILCSDSHDVNTLCFEFLKWEQVAREIGFSDICSLQIKGK